MINDITELCEAVGEERIVLILQQLNLWFSELKCFAIDNTTNIQLFWFLMGYSSLL